MTMPSEIAQMRMEFAVESLLRHGRLPRSLTIEPGSFITVLTNAWGYDGRRRGEMTSSTLARLISEHIGKDFSRDDIGLKFGQGKMLSGKQYKTKVERNTVCAYVKIALSHWSKIGNTFASYRGWSKEEISSFSEKVCEVMFGDKSSMLCLSPNASTEIPPAPGNMQILDVMRLVERLDEESRSKATLSDIEYLIAIERWLGEELSPDLIVQVLRVRPSPFEIMLVLEAQEQFGGNATDFLSKHLSRTDT